MGLPKIGAVLALDGEREYKSAISSVNAAQRELRSEMKLATEEFYGQGNSLEALVRKQEILTQQQEAQEKKVEICRAAVDKYANAQEAAGQRVEEATGKLKAAEERLAELEKTTGATTEEIEEQKKAVAKAREELEVSNRAYDDAVKKNHEWSISLNNAEADQKKINRTLEENKGYLKEAETATDQCASSIDEYGKKVKEASGEAEIFNEKTTNAVTAISTVLASEKILEKMEDIAGSLMDCVAAAAAFETATAKVATIADTSKVPMESMRKEILAVSSDLGIGAEAIADASYNAISAGQATEKAVGFAGQATKLSIGGFTDATTAVDILTTTLNAYNLEAEETESISNMLVTTQNLGKTTVAELASNMGRVIPLASAYNMQMDNLSTSYAIMTANGINTAETTTYIKSILNELGDTGSKVSKTLLEKTGKTFVQLNKEGASLGDVMWYLGDAVEGDRTKFSALWSSSEAGIGALSLLNSGTEKYNTTLKAMQNSTGATEKAFRTMADTTEMAKARMENSIQNLKIAIGEELKPAINDVYEAGADLSDWAAEFVEEHPEIAKALAALTAGTIAFAGALTVATAAKAAFDAIMQFVNPTNLLITALIGVTVAATAFAVAMSEEPEGIRKTNIETQELIKNTKELNAAYDESTKGRSSARQDMEAEAVVCKNLAQELAGLQAKTNLTASEQARQNSIISQLNQAMPELNLAIDEQTGKINMSTEALQENVDAMMMMARAEAAREDQQEIAKEQYEIEKNLLELDAQLAEQKEAVAKAQENLNQAMEEGKEKYQGQIELYDTVTETTALREAIEIQKELEEQIASTRESYNALGEEYARTEEYIGNTEAMAEASSATENLGNSTAEAGDKISGTAETVKQAFADMGESIRESVQEQMDIFSEFEEQNSIDGGKIVANMESQVTGMKNWGENISALADRTTEDGERISEGLLEHLVDLGPEGAAYVQSFVEMTDEELKRANELWAESITLPDMIAEQFTEAGENIVAGLTQGMEEGISAIEETGLYLGEGLAIGIEGNAETVEKAMKAMAVNSLRSLDNAFEIHSPSKKTMETGKQLMAGLGQGVTKNKPVVLNALKEVTNETLTTTKRELATEIFHGIGLQVDAGLANGIRAGKSQVINAAVEVARASITAAKSELGIHSPSKATEEMGGNYMEGWVLGIRAKTEHLKDAVRGALSESLLQEVEPSFKGSGIAMMGSASEGAGQAVGDIQIYIQPQQMTEDELDKTFDYMNKRFGLAL